MLKHLSSKAVLATIYFFSLLLFFVHTHFTKTAVYADGKFYYSITRSIVKDFDIDFENEYKELGIGVDRTKTGYVWNMYPPGASLLWIPGFVLAEGFVNILNLLPSIDLSGAGYSLVHQTTVAASSITLGILGLLLILRLLGRFFSDKIALIAVATLFATTNLLFYISIEQINSHAVSFFISSVFVYVFVVCNPNRRQSNCFSPVMYYFILGIIGGVAGLVRTQDAMLLAIPLIKIWQEKFRGVASFAAHHILMAAGFIIAYLPQLYFWKKIFGTIGSPYSQFGFNFLSPKIGHVLLNSKNGLIFTTPVILAAVVGLIILIRTTKTSRLKNIAVFGLFYFLLQLYLISAWNFYDQGGSYSIRMIVSTYPLLTFGLAESIRRVKMQVSQKTLLVSVATLGLANSLMLIRYLLLY